MVEGNISICTLKNIFLKGEEVFRNFLCEKVGRSVRVTKKKQFIDNLVTYFKINN